MSEIKAHEFTAILENAVNSKGTVALPNVTQIEDLQEALWAVSSGTLMEGKSPYEFRLREFDPPLRGVQTHEMTWYPKIFLNTGGMGGHFDGTGTIISQGKAYRFEMCKHDWDESGANHSRGWHPKRCCKCGFDASIDSGD